MDDGAGGPHHAGRVVDGVGRDGELELMVQIFFVIDNLSFFQAVKGFETLQPPANVIKLFTAVSFEFL